MPPRPIRSRGIFDALELGGNVDGSGEGRRVLGTGPGRTHDRLHLHSMIESIAGAVVWLIANGVYIDMRRRNTRGFGRLCAFWMGWPATWLWFAAVPEGRHVEVRPPPDDEAALLAEIRRDRALRSGDDPEAAEPEREGD